MSSHLKKVIVVMGVSGCGKTTVGKALATQLAGTFYDGDDLHPPENIAKMSAGMPLDDEDRAPWLAALNRLLHIHLEAGKPAVVACSALKRKYRDLLRAGNPGVEFIYLQGSFDLIWSRMADRRDHYMKPEMLRSQFDALEEPGEDEAVTIPISLDIDSMIAFLLEK